MTEVFGMPVSGQKHESGWSHVEQKPLEDLRQAFLDLINDPNVVEFGWQQYTPYFNDGDVCEFSVCEPWIRTVDDADEDLDYYDLEIGDYHPTLCGKEWRETMERAKKLCDIASGSYDRDLLEAFGDHCQVTVTKDGFVIDEYSHD